MIKTWRIETRECRVWPQAPSKGKYKQLLNCLDSPETRFCFTESQSISWFTPLLRGCTWSVLTHLMQISSPGSLAQMVWPMRCALSQDFSHSLHLSTHSLLTFPREDVEALLGLLSFHEEGSQCQGVKGHLAPCHFPLLWGVLDRPQSSPSILFSFCPSFCLVQ